MFAICGAWADEWGVGRRVGCGQMSGAWADDDGVMGRRVVRRDPDSGCQGVASCTTKPRFLGGLTSYSYLGATRKCNR